MRFEDFSLDPCILAGVRSAGFTLPTPIQEQAIPVVLQDRDLLGLAQTGTGKTAAFLLPIFQRLIQYPTRKVRVLILAPTRELAEQIHQTSVELGQHTGVRSVAIYGGVGKGPQMVKLRRGPEIVVACPGRLRTYQHISLTPHSNRCVFLNAERIGLLFRIPPAEEGQLHEMGRGMDMR